MTPQIVEIIMATALLLIVFLVGYGALENAREKRERTFIVGERVVVLHGQHEGQYGVVRDERVRRRYLVHFDPEPGRSSGDNDLVRDSDLMRVDTPVRQVEVEE